MLPHYPPLSKWTTTCDIDESGETYARPNCEGTLLPIDFEKYVQ